MGRIMATDLQEFLLIIKTEMQIASDLVLWRQPATTYDAKN
jgi:hypothetical protein